MSKIGLYVDATSEFNNDDIVHRRLSYALDNNKTRYYNCFFPKDAEIIEEIYYRKLLETMTGYKIYLNPRTHTNGIKTPDFWFEDTDELWDLKGIDGNSINVIDNILHNASRNFQAPNIILKQRNTNYNITALKE